METNTNNKIEFETKIFYDFHDNMSFLRSYSNDEFKEIITKLFSDTINCKEEIFSVINSSLRINKEINEIIKDELTKSRAKIEKFMNSENFDSEDQYLAYQISTHVSLREDRFHTLEKEVEMQSMSAIVILLSLLESTLHEMIQKLRDFNEEVFPDIKGVFKRDKGIAKYLKYLEKYLTDKNFIVAMPLYNEILHWAGLRNNIVHNANKYNEELFNNSLKFNINVKRNREMKFSYNTVEVIQLAQRVAEILNLCIVDGLYNYCDVDFIEIEAIYPKIVVE